MLKVLTALAVTLLLVSSANAYGPCAKYGNKQCGCQASHILFGREVSGLAAVSSWYRFPRTQCHVGAAAIWPGRHVEVVNGMNSDGTPSTIGSVGFSHARGVICVEPSGSSNVEYAAARQPVRYAARHAVYAYRGHRQYASLKGVYAIATTPHNGPWR